MEITGHSGGKKATVAEQQNHRHRSCTGIENRPGDPGGLC